MAVLTWFLSPVGRWVGLAIAAMAVLAWLRWDARRDGAETARREHIEQQVESHDAANREAAGFRGDGAVRRLRDGAF